MCNKNLCKKDGSKKKTAPFLKKGGEFFQFKVPLFLKIKRLIIPWKNGTLFTVKEIFSF